MALNDITQLKDLEALNDDAFCEAFSAKLGLIFQYAKDDIVRVIELRDLATVQKLRTTLCTAAKVAFDNYTEASTVQRKVMPTASSDVYALGYSLANKLPTRDLDKIFVKGRDNPGESTSDPEITELAEFPHSAFARGPRSPVFEERMRAAMGATGERSAGRPPYLEWHVYWFLLISTRDIKLCNKLYLSFYRRW